MKFGVSKVPFGIAAIVVVLTVFVVDLAIWSGMTFLFLVPCFLFLGLGWWKPSYWKMALFVGLLAGSLHYVRTERQRASLAGVGSLVYEEVVLLSEFRSTELGAWGVAKVKGGTYQGVKVRLFITRGADSVRRGDILSVRGSFREIPVVRNPGDFDQREWMRRKGVSLALWVNDWSLSGAVWWRPVSEWFLGLRSYIDKRVTGGLSEYEAVLVRAIFLGEKPQEEIGIMNDFRNSGTLHVFAVSGLHVMMVGGVVFFVVRVFRLPLVAQVVLVVLMMSIYAGVTGANAPAVRAVLMGGLLVAGFPMRRPVVVLNSLAVCIVIVCIADGHSIFQPGFQLSYGVIIALVIFHPLWSKWLAFLYRVDEFLPRQLYGLRRELSVKARTKGAEAIAVGCSAWCGSSWLVWWHFGVISPIAVLAGLPMVLMVWGVLFLCCVGIVVGAFSSGLGSQVARLNGKLASSVRVLASWCAEAPGGHFRREPWASGERVIIYDVGKGGSAGYIDIAGGVLIDCGSEPFANRVLIPSLKEMGGQVDSVIFTHGDSGHTGGGVMVLETGSVRQCVVGDDKARSPSYRDVIELLKGSAVSVVQLQGRERFVLDKDSNMDVYRVEGGGDAADDDLLLVKLNWRGSGVLFAGDVGFTGFRSLVEQGVDLKSEVLVMGSHGYDSVDMDVVLEVVKPRIMIVGRESYKKDISRREQLSVYLKSTGGVLFDQERHGAITLTQSGTEIQVEPMIPSK